MDWINIQKQETLKEIDEISSSKRVMILKYSPGHIIDYVVKNLLEREWISREMKMETYLLDVAAQPELSEAFSVKYSIPHETPQVIMIENNKPVFTASNGKILFSEIRKFKN